MFDGKLSLFSANFAHFLSTDCLGFNLSFSTLSILNSDFGIDVAGQLSSSANKFFEVKGQLISDCLFDVLNFPK